MPARNSTPLKDIFLYSDYFRYDYKNMKRIFSGVAPSGVIHIGNYLGAIKNWLKLQDEYQSVFCVVDEHALTIYQKPEKLRKKILETAAIYLAAGLNPKKSIIFIQSHVPAHTELCWILNTIAKIPELERMTQFKEKAAEHRSQVNMGLFDYPVLMAADILLYKTDAVPVGLDQKQHVELTRVLARRFNQIYGKTFTIPKVLIKKQGAKIMGLDNPLKKMSKSAANPYNYIALTDSPEVVGDKIKKAVTDSGKEIKYDSENKPAVSNLLTIYSLIADKSIKSLELKYENSGYADFKNDLAEELVKFLKPFFGKYQKLIQKPAYLKKILADGAKRAEDIAETTIKEVKNKIGLI